MTITCHCLKTGFRSELRPDGTGSTVPWKTRALLYLGASYLVDLDATVRTTNSGSKAGLLLVPLFILIITMPILGSLTAVASAVDRFVLARSAVRTAPLLLLLLAPLPAWIFPVGSDEFRGQLTTQLIFGLAVALLELRTRRTPPHRPNS